MIVPFVALVVVIIALVWFMSMAAKRKNKGQDLGDPGNHTAHGRMGQRPSHQ